MLFQCNIILNSLSIKKISDFIVKFFFAALLLQKMCNETKWRYIKNFESNQVEKEIVLYLNIKEDKIDELEHYKLWTSEMFMYFILDVLCMKTGTCPIDNQTIAVVVANIAVSEQIGEMFIHCRHGCRLSEDGQTYELDPTRCQATVKVATRVYVCVVLLYWELILVLFNL